MPYDPASPEPTNLFTSLDSPIFETHGGGPSVNEFPLNMCLILRGLVLKLVPLFLVNTTVRFDPEVCKPHKITILESGLGIDSF